MKSLFAALGLALVSTVRASGDADPDSFGNAVTYLGLVDTSTVWLEGKCPSTLPRPDDRCIELNPQPGSTTFAEGAIGSIDLPPAATETLLCYSVSPIATRTFRNKLSATHRAELRATLMVTIESSVLQDPSLIDPYTGLPLNGSLPHGSLIAYEARDMAAASTDIETPRHSRSCAYGMVRRSELIDYYGLTSAQADAFFSGPITVTFALTGTARLVESASYRLYIRLYGDRK